MMIMKMDMGHTWRMKVRLPPLEEQQVGHLLAEEVRGHVLQSLDQDHLRYLIIISSIIIMIAVVVMILHIIVLPTHQLEVEEGHPEAEDVLLISINSGQVLQVMGVNKVLELCQHPPPLLLVTIIVPQGLREGDHLMTYVLLRRMIFVR